MKADVGNFPDWRGGYSRDMLIRLLQDKNCLGFYYTDKETETPVGTIWVMFSGGNEVEYKIRNIGAFIFNVYVKTEYRGRGIARELLNIATGEVGSRGIKKCYLAVRTDNHSAIRAYHKYGFTTVDEKRFLRVLGKNIPYITL